MHPGSSKKEKPYASCTLVPSIKQFSELAVKHFNDKYDNYRMSEYSNSSSVVGSDSLSGSSGSNIDTTELSEEDRQKIDICFRGLKTQVFICNSMANLYYRNDDIWELLYTGIPVIILESGETRSRSKRLIKIILAEKGTCFALWQDIIDNLSSYKLAGHAFHTMCLSTDHRKVMGLSFDYPDAAKELWQHIEHLTSNPENISLSVPGRKAKKNKKIQQKLPEKNTISPPCWFQHVTSVDLKDRQKYLSMQKFLSVAPIAKSEHSSQA